jgi:hypothetical protein
VACPGSPYSRLKASTTKRLRLVDASLTVLASGRQLTSAQKLGTPNCEQVD